MTPFSKNTGKVMTKYTRAAGGTALTLNFRPQEATALRTFVDSVRLRGDKIPSLSLVARRAMTHYLGYAQMSPTTRTTEISALEALATPFTDRAKTKTPG